MCSREDIILCPALNIKAESAKGRELLILAFTGKSFNMCIHIHVNLYLTVCHFRLRLAFCPVLRLNTNPAHATNFVVDHVALCIRDIRLICNFAQTVFLAKQNVVVFNHTAEEAQVLWMLKVQLQEFLFRGMIATSEWILGDKLYLGDGILDTATIIFVLFVKDIVELYSELFDFCVCQRDSFILLFFNLDVEIGHEVVDVGADRVSTCIDAKQADYRFWNLFIYIYSTK